MRYLIFAISPIALSKLHAISRPVDAISERVADSAAAVALNVGRFRRAAIVLMTLTMYSFVNAVIMHDYR